MAAENILSQNNEFKPVPLNLIDVNELNVRKEIDREDLEELKKSISTLGLLQPIVLMKKSGTDRLQLIIGQRRYRACKELKKQTIPAIILQEKDEKTALALSLAENLERSELGHNEMVNAITKLYELYNSDDRKVAKAAGIPLITVRRYILIKKYASDKALKWLAEKKVNLMDIKRALEAAQYEILKADRILEKMMKMTGEEKRRITRYAKVNPGAPVDQILKGSQDLRAQIKIFVDLTNDVREALIKAQNSLNMEEGEIAAEAIERWLHDKGFIE